MGGSGHFERMEADIQVLQKQALATQRTIQQLQAREPTDAYTAVVAEWPNLPKLPAVDSAMFGALAVLATVTVLLWWYLWHRPHAQLSDAAPLETQDVGPLHERVDMTPPRTRDVLPKEVTVYHSAPLVKPTPAPAPLAETRSVSKPKRKPEAESDPVTLQDSRNHEDAVPVSPSTSLFARSDPGLWFDSEAAAGEVTRVRKSLAEKREARSMLLEYEDEQPVKPASELHKPASRFKEPSVDVAQPVALEKEQKGQEQEGQEGQGQQPQHAPEVVLVDEPNPASASVETVLPAPLVAPASVVVAEPLGEPEPEPEPESEAESETIPKEMPVAEPTPVALEAPAVTQHTQTAHAPPYTPSDVDYSVTLALALESAELDLWSEARELAYEVLESGDTNLKDPALALLQRIDAFEKQQVLSAQMLDDNS